MKRLSQKIIIICIVLAIVSVCTTTKDSTLKKTEGIRAGAIIGKGIG